MLVTVSNVGDYQPSEVELQVLKSLSGHFEKLTAKNVIEDRSKSLQRQLNSYVPPEGFERIAQAGIASLEPTKARANYRVDLAITNSLKSLAIPVELALNNREAVGTNLLKLESFNRFTAYKWNTPFGILISPTTSLLSLGGWDSSYADNLEYLDLRKNVYAPALKLPLFQIELHGLF